MSLSILNLARWIREYFVSWGVLSFVYSLTVTLLLQPLLEHALKTTLPLGPLWGLTCALLLLPGLTEAIPFPPMRLRAGFFSERIWNSLGGPLGPLYLRHEFRRGTTWFAILLTVFVGALLPPGKAALWIIIAQFPLQRALYSIHRWRGLAHAFYPTEGAGYLIRAVASAQALQALIAWLALRIANPAIAQDWLRLGAPSLAAILCGASVALEGDSGRPWLVNFISLAAGVLAGYLCLASPWFLLLAGYLCLRVYQMAALRLKSVEHLDEDTLIP